jgi:glutamyl-tRNA synthetase
MDEERFVAHVRDRIFSPDYLKQLRPLVLERMERLEQFVDNNAFFFNGGLAYDQVPLVPQGKTPAEVAGMLSELVEQLDEVYDWDAEHLKAALDAHKAKIGWKPKDYFMTVRLVVTGRKDSPPLVESMAILGREMTRFRLRDVLRHPQLQG